MAVTLGEATTTDVIIYATTTKGRHVRKVQLHELLHSQPHWTRAKSLAALRHLGQVLEMRDDLGAKSVSWLIDPKSGGRRVLAWLDIHAVKGPPWPGFPFTPQPKGWALPPPRLVPQSDSN